MAELAGNPVAHLTEYELRHLAEHLEASGQVEALHRLLVVETDGQRNAWYEAKDDIGDVEGYLRNIKSAWTHAGKDPRKAPSIQLSREALYALIHSSVATLAANAPPELIKALLELKKWDAPKARAYVDNMRYPDQRMQSRAILVSYSSQERQDDIRKIVSELPKANEETRFRVLREIAVYVPSDLVPELTSLALSIRQEYARVIALSSLLPRASTRNLQQRILIEILRALPSIRSSSERNRALQSLSQHIPCEMVDDLFSLVLEQRQPDGFVALVEVLVGSPDLLVNLAPRMLLLVSLIFSFQNDELVHTALLTLLSHLPDSALSSALKTIHIDLAPYPYHRIQALIAFLSRRPTEDTRRSAVESAAFALSQISDETTYKYATSLVARHIFEEEKQLLFDRLESGAGAKPADLRDVEQFADTILAKGGRTARKLDIHALFQMLCSNPVWAADYVSRLPPGFELRMEDVRSLDQALDDQLGEMNFGRDRSNLWLILAPILPGEAINELGEMVHGLDEFERSEVLAQIAPKVPTDSLWKLLELAALLHPEDALQAVLAALGPHIVPDHLVRSVETAFPYDGLSDRDEQRARVLLGLMPSVRPGILPEIRSAAESISDPYQAARVLGTLALHLPEKGDQSRVLNQALSLAEGIGDRAVCRETESVLRGQWLRYGLHRYVREAKKESDLLALMMVGSRRSRQRIRGLVGRFSPILRGDSLRRSLVLFGLAALVAVPVLLVVLLLIAALSIVLTIPWLLIGLAMSLYTLLGLLVSVLEGRIRIRRLAASLRSDRLDGNGQDRAIGALVEQIADAIEWHRPFSPRVLSELPCSVIAKAINRAEGLHEPFRTNAIVALSAGLPNGEREQVLEEIEIGLKEMSAQRRVAVISKVAPYVPEEAQRFRLLNEAADALGEISEFEDKWLEQAIPGLVRAWRHLRKEDQRKMLSVTLRHAADHPRSEFLELFRRLKPLLRSLGGRKATSQIAPSVRKVAVWWP